MQNVRAAGAWYSCISTQHMPMPANIHGRCSVIPRHEQASSALTGSRYGRSDRQANKRDNLVLSGLCEGEDRGAGAWRRGHEGQ